jgi:hypothetical protein
MSELDKLPIKAGAHGVVTVSVPHQVFYNVDKMHEVTKAVLGRLGCLACHSGFDIRFQQEIQFVAGLDAKVRALGE